ncbi:MAG: ABC transporter substrate-binding protein [Rhodoferax sp.]|jgi:iron(III) transport system substrate-binding protein|nr:ABC transporter substrate-binding protein [Rhodoferax sp.]
MALNKSAAGWSRRGALGAVGALALGAAGVRAQQGDANWQRTVAAAKKEGSLVIYHQAVPQVLDRVTKDFMAVYPEIKVEYRRLLTPVTHMQAIESEKAGKLDGADITQYANAIWYRDKAQENFFLKPVGPATAEYPKDSLLYGAVATVAVMPFVMAYNTNLVKTPITSMKDLLKPEFKGKVGSSDIVAETVYAFYEWIEKTQGADFLPQFAAQKPKLTVGVLPLFQSIAAGELAAGLYGIHSVANSLIAQGAPLKVVQPNPAFASVDVLAALAHSRRPNAALVFLDYMMSRRGQGAWNGSGETASVLPGVPGSLDARTMQPWDVFRYTPEFQRDYKLKFDKLFKA